MGRRDDGEGIRMGRRDDGKGSWRVVWEKTVCVCVRERERGRERESVCKGQLGDGGRKRQELERGNQKSLQ